MHDHQRTYTDDLRLQLERRRLQYEELEQQQKELRSQASDKHLMSVTTAATLELEKESVSALRAQLKEALVRESESVRGLACMRL